MAILKAGKHRKAYIGSKSDDCLLEYIDPMKESRDPSKTIADGYIPPAGVKTKRIEPEIRSGPISSEQVEPRKIMGMIGGLTRHIPPGQFLRYILVGVWNTIFGYTCFILFTWLFIRLLPANPAMMTSAAYMLAAFVNISVSFLGYKWFVFRTKGNYLLEYLRSFTVYLPTIAINAIAIAPLTVLLRHTTPFPQEAPYVAGGILMVIAVVLSFLGHRHISFRQKST